MSKYFYPTLAATNLRKNSKNYVPYILTCSFMVMIVYIMDSISNNSGVGNGSLKAMLTVGSIISAIFSVVFLFYTNSFLVKRRQKEFGLFNILGMDKKHICRTMLWETVYTAAISLTLGLVGGIILSKLMFLLLLKLLHFDVNMAFEVIPKSFLFSIILFVGIFAMTLLNTIRIIHLSKPVELLKGGQTGEKEPKSKLLITLAGMLSLGGGYYLALFTESPLAAIGSFLLAVILVMAGTYCLFTSGSITFLKFLRGKKNYYYKTKHFTSISGMIYRMKQNAVGLGNICILSTAVLVTVSTTVSMYIGVDDLLRTRFHRNIIVQAQNVSDEQAAVLDAVILSETKKAGASNESIIRRRYASFVAVQNGSVFLKGEDNDFGLAIGSSKMITILDCMLLSEYNEMADENYTLNSNEILICELKGNIDSESITVADIPFIIKEKINKPDEINEDNHMMLNLLLVVVPNLETIEILNKVLSDNAEETMGLSYEYGFDTAIASEEQIELSKAIRTSIKSTGIDAIVESAEAEREGFYELYGGIFFLGIFLGLLFITATVLIMYYKQISEGFEDKERFDIMQKVGMSRAEVKSSIHSQVLTVFFLPLITAGIHIAVAFKLITKLLSLFNLTNIPLFAMCMLGTMLVFGVFYAAIYALTARVYYKIVY